MFYSQFFRLLLEQVSTLFVALAGLDINSSHSSPVLAGLIVSDQVIATSSKIAFTVTQKTEEFVTLSTVYFALSIATSLTTTLLISLRIGLVQRAAKKAGIAKRNTYNAVIEILVESAVLYSATLLIFVVLNTRKNINFYYPQNIHAQVAVRLI